MRDYHFYRSTDEEPYQSYGGYWIDKGTACGLWYEEGWWANNPSFNMTTQSAPIGSPSITADYHGVVGSELRAGGSSLDQYDYPYVSGIFLGAYADNVYAHICSS